MSDAAEAQNEELSGLELLLDKSIGSYLKLPMLEVIYDRFVRVASTSLRNYTSENVDVEIEEMSNARFGEFTEDMGSSIIAVFKAVEWDNYGLLVINSDLIYSFVDILFGGKKVEPLKVEDRPFTSIEQNILQAITEIILNDLSASFEPVTPVTFQLDRMETNPRFATISRPEDVAIVLKLKLVMESRSGSVDIMLPYATIEPVKKILAQSFIGERGGKDPTWLRHFELELGQSKVDMEVILNGKSSKMYDMCKMKVGDTIVLDKLANEELCVKVNNQKVALGKVGKVDDKMAIQFSDGINLKRFKG